MRIYKMTLAALLVSVLVGGNQAAAQNGDASDRFEKPIELLSEGSTIGLAMYPSPTLYDLDGDGQRELLIGEIFGSIHTSQKAKGEGLHLWESFDQLESDGEPLKLNNW